MTIKERQPTVYRLFSTLIKNDKLQHAYLLEGSPGSGREHVARWVACSKFCENKQADGLPCLTCHACRRVLDRQHPDVFALEADGATIKVDQVRAVRQEFSKSGLEGSGKVLIVMGAERMTTSAANSLLKFLEEPEGDVLIFLLTENSRQLLPTITSRAQLVQFQRPAKPERVAHLMSAGLSKKDAGVLSAITEDSDRARELAGDEHFQTIVGTAWRLAELLWEGNSQAFIYIQTDVMKHLTGTSDLALLLDLLVAAYRDLLKTKSGRLDELSFLGREERLQQFAGQVTHERLARELLAVTSGRRMIKSHVATQSVLEYVILTILNPALSSE